MHRLKKAKTLLQLWICLIIKIYISLEISVTDTVHTPYLGNILIPRRLLSIGYQPWEGNAGRGVGARCWKSEIQPSSSRPPDEDTNPPGHASSLKDISFSVFAIRDLTEHAKTNPCPSHPSSNCSSVAGHPWFHMAGSEPLPWLATGLWASGACGHLPSLFNKVLLSAYPEQGPSPNTNTLLGAGCHQCGWAVE